MKKSVCLPFEVPIFATTQGAAATGLAMIGHPTAFNYLLNNSTSLYCTRKFIKGFTTPEVSVPDSGIFSCGFMVRYGVNFKYSFPHCMDIIKNMLNDKLYIYYNRVDDFYLPGKSWYGTRHIYHDGVICGYDDNDGTLSIAAYDINWLYSLIRIPQEAFIKGMQSAFEVEQYGTFTGYKIRNNVVIDLEEKKIINNIKEYLESDFKAYPTDVEGGVRGAVVHDYLCIYLKKIIDGSVPYEKMDWRVLRPVWEHKKCMLERIRAVEIKNAWDKYLGDAYMPIVEKANYIRMMYALYHRRRKDSILSGVIKELMELKNEEKQILAQFVERMETSIMTDVKKGL
mgnify:CR=1 FL=1